jgi:hypothetical protein
MQAAINPPPQVSPSDSGSEDSDTDQNHLDHEHSINPVQQPTPGTSGQGLEERIDRLIKDRLEQMMADTQPNKRKRPSTDQLDQGAPSNKSNKQSASPTGLSAVVPVVPDFNDDSASEFPSSDPEPAVRQVFGLLVGENVSLKLRNDIIADKYIEFYDLLPEATTEDQTLVFKKSDDNSVRLVKESKHKFISLDQWNMAFASYMAVYHTKASTHKLCSNLLLEMLTYQRDINTLAKQQLPWFRYDIQFRKDRSVNPSRFSFSDLRHDLIASLKTFSVNRSPFRQGQGQTRFDQRTSSFNNRNSYQGTSNTNQGTSTAKGNTTNQGYKVPPGHCFAFHSKNNLCRTPGGQCRFKHTCPKCTQRHPVFQCKN